MEASQKHAMEVAERAERRLIIVREALRVACGSMCDYEDALALFERARQQVNALTANLEQLRIQYARLKMAQSKA